MRKSIFILLLFILSLASVILNGCKVSSLTRDEIVKNDFPVAIIDDSLNVMASDLYIRLANSNLLEDGGVLDSTTYFDTLKSIVLDSIVSLEALTIDLKKDLPLYNLYENRYFEFYIRYLYNAMVIDSVKFDSLEVVRFAEAQPERFAYREQVHARQITISPEGLLKGADSLTYLDFGEKEIDSVAEFLVYDIKAQIDSGADFGYLADLYSAHRESGKRDGDLGYFPRDKYLKEFTEVAFSLPIGEISDPFLAQDGWHIIEVIDHIDSGLAIDKPEVFEMAAGQYVNSLAHTRSAFIVDSLEASATYKFNDSALVLNPYDVADSVWAVIANDVDTINFFRMADYQHQFRTSTNISSFTTETMHAFLKNRCRKFLLARMGDQFGYNNDEPVKKEREQLYHKYAVDLVLKDRSPEKFTPTDSMIETYYNERLDQYVIAKPLNVQHIIAEDSLFAEYLRDQAISGVDFLELAQEHYPGAEEIRVAAADLGYIGEGELPEQFFTAALGTSIGGVSKPVKTDWGYHIIKVIDKKFTRTIDDVRLEIIEELQKSYGNKFIEDWNENLIATHKVVYNLDPIKRLELDSKQRR